MHVISGFPPIQSNRYDLIRYTQYQFRYDTDPIIVRSINVTTRNMQAFAAADTTALEFCLVHLRYPDAHFIVRVPVRQWVPGRNGYLDAQVPVDRPN